MPPQKLWLESLTLAKLHKLAVLIGAPCSGTKAVRITGIRDAASRTNLPAGKTRNLPDLRLLSIDMGIRNLAFAHLTAPVERRKDSDGYYQYGKPRLQAWHRMSVANSQRCSADAVSASIEPKDEGGSLLPTTTPTTKVTKESFEPIDYAAHAYSVIKHLLVKHNPNYILIERQRFRSGGNSAVQEWTIRVGVFEGMLYAVLRTLAEEQELMFDVEPVQPPRVNRSWLEGVETAGKRPSGREMKKAKIGLVGEMLEAEAAKSCFALSKQLRPLANDFVSVWKKEAKSKRSTNESVGKLDDLADSLLQGLAWINWQNNRLRFNSLGEQAFDLDTS